MFKRTIYIALGLALLLLSVNVNRANAVVPHSSINGIECVDCHFLHTGSLVARGAEQQSLCRSCHNLTDPNTASLSVNDPNMHIVDGGATIIDCGSCHDPHGSQTVTNPHSGGQTLENLSLVRGDTAKYVTGALEPAIFQTRPNHFAFDTPATTDPNTFHGICQTCHTSISRHTNDGIDDSTTLAADNSHGIGSDCMTCHPHEDGFAGSGGGCTDCHNTSRDNGNDGIIRRAVVGEFNLTSHHILAGTVTNEDCLVCHMEEYGQSYHENNVIDLRDPDTGNALTSFSQFTSSVYTYVQDNLCLKCHDSGGATSAYNPSGSALRPFSSDIGYDVPNVFSQLDTSNNYYHPVRGPGNNPYTVPSASNGNNITMESPWNQDAIHDQITCFDCHNANGHGSNNQRALLDPIDFDTMESTINSSNLPAGMGVTVETFCSRCHKASVYVNSSDPEGAGSIFEYHGSAQNQHRASGGNELGCMGCHGGIAALSGGVINGAARGNIHGGNFTWGTDSFSSGTTTDYFMLGGWISGWMTDIDKGNPIGSCRGGDCNHRNSSKTYSQ